MVQDLVPNVKKTVISLFWLYVCPNTIQQPTTQPPTSIMITFHPGSTACYTTYGSAHHRAIPRTPPCSDEQPSCSDRHHKPLHQIRNVQLEVHSSREPDPPVAATPPGTVEGSLDLPAQSSRRQLSDAVVENVKNFLKVRSGEVLVKIKTIILCRDCLTDKLRLLLSLNRNSRT